MRIVVLLLLGFMTSLLLLQLLNKQLDGFVTRFITNMFMIKSLYL